MLLIFISSIKSFYLNLNLFGKFVISVYFNFSTKQNTQATHLLNKTKKMKAMFTFVIMLFVLSAGTSFSQDKQDWKYMHPTPQNNILRKVKMVDENTWVTTGANGGFMKSTNSGLNWYLQFFCGKVTANTLATTQNYDMWFFDGNTGIVTGDQGFFGRTVNGGVTFDSAYSYLIPTNSRNYSVWFADANTGCIGSGSQNAFTTTILKTTNAGLSWTKVYQDLSGSTSYLTALGGSGNTICAAWQNGSCVRSSDGGATWTVIPSQFTPGNIVNGIEFADANNGFAAGSQGTFSRTTDAGLTWTNLSTPQVDWAYFQVKVVSLNEIYLIGDAGNLYRSSNQGTSWTTLPINVSGPAVTFVWYSLDHYGSTFVLSGDYGIIAKSTDGCATWTAPGYTQLTNQFGSQITTVPGTSKYWIVSRAFPFGSTTGQIQYSSNSGTDWELRNLGVTGDLQAISMINENTGYASGTNNQVFKTTNGGSNWFAKTSPSPNASSQLYSCEFIDENTGWVFVNFSTVAGGNVFKTTNGGDNWNQYSTGASSENIYAADMVDANTGFCVMNQSNRPIYRTTNGGVNWTGATTTGFTGSVHGISSPDGITVYACQSAGTSRLAKSTNGGVNFSLITLPAVVDFSHIYFKDANTGYVTGNNTSAICRTTNGGATWTFQNTHNITTSAVFASQGDTAWALGGNGAIMRYIGSSSPITLNLTVSMEAMYAVVPNELVRKDPVTVYLRNASSPYAIVDSATAVIDSITFTGQFTFSNAPSGQYYIVAKHFNSLETWSRSGGETMLASGIYNYNFTDLSNKAYGSNMVLKGSKYCIYSGDINNDGLIDLTDLVATYNDAVTFVSGSYVITDINADNIVDLADVLAVNNNSSIFIAVSRP